MRANLANINYGVVCFLSCAAFNLCWYYNIAGTTGTIVVPTQAIVRPF